MFSNFSINGTILVEANPDWVTGGFTSTQYVEKYKELVPFYVLNCIVPGMSSMRISVSSYGWDKPWAKPQYLNKKIKHASSNPSLYWSASKYEAMEEAVRKGGLLHFDPKKNPLLESACFYDSKRNQTLSLFSHIRNSLCHGRFAIFEESQCLWIAMEDVAKKRNSDPGNTKRLSARILLKYSTLLEWRRIIQEGPGKTPNPV